MTRSDAIAMISAKLASFNDERVLAVADVVRSMEQSEQQLRQLSPRERALIEQSKQDFKAGRTYSHIEMVAYVDEQLARLGVPPSTT